MGELFLGLRTLWGQGGVVEFDRARTIVGIRDPLAMGTFPQRSL